MNHHRASAVLLAIAVISPVCASAASIPVADTQDTFVYQFLGTSTGSSLSGFFPGIIAVANDAPHVVNSFVAFDGVGSTGVSSGDVSSATLTLTVATGPGFGPGPTPVAPVIVDLFAASAAWTPSTITWLNQPGPASGLIGQVNDDGSLSTITFDVTSVVKQWLDGSLANNGFILTQDNVGTQSLSFNALGVSGSPLLTINTVPEPSSFVLSCVGMGAIVIGAARHRRRRARLAE